MAGTVDLFPGRQPWAIEFDALGVGGNCCQQPYILIRRWGSCAEALRERAMSNTRARVFRVEIEKGGSSSPAREREREFFVGWL